ncbi:MAG: flippase-like domain-containing protein [ANME-2 cluster archaeon]|jgi:uncharacterized protein (TIRG00374 family)|nr:flippase-like domain-containing protein [ANME-2 cluster archaeon]
MEWSKYKKRISWLLKLFISIAILFYIFRIIPVNEVLNSIASANFIYILIALPLVPFIVFLNASKMKILIDKQRMSLSVRHIFDITFITHFYSLFLPGDLTSGVIRWYKLSRPDKKPAEALASVVFNRIIDTIIIVVIGILFWALDKPPNSNYSIGFTLFAILIGLIGIHLSVFNRKISLFLMKHLNSIFRVPETIKKKINKVLISAIQFNNLPRISIFNILGLSLSSHLAGILLFYLFALSLGIQLSFINIGWIRSSVIIITLLPISFSGLGLRDSTLIFMLGLYSISPINAVALSFLLFANDLAKGGIGGLIEARDQFFSYNVPEINEEMG